MLPIFLTACVTCTAAHLPPTLPPTLDAPIPKREAADTQRRLYLRQSELETELEDLNAHHDALRVELARMDASIENASDTSFHRTPSSSATSMGGRGGRLRAGGGRVASPKSTGRDPASIGAEVGGAVGGILRGKFWSGWGGGSVTSADTNGGGSTGEVGTGKGPAAAARKGSKARREGGRRDGEGKISAGAAGAGEADQQVRQVSFSACCLCCCRVRLHCFRLFVCPQVLARRRTNQSLAPCMSSGVKCPNKMETPCVGVGRNDCAACCWCADDYCRAQRRSTGSIRFGDATRTIPLTERTHGNGVAFKRTHSPERIVLGQGNAWRGN